MTIRVLPFFVLFFGLATLTATVLGQNQNTETKNENPPVIIEPINQEKFQGKSVQSAIIIAPTPSRENTIELPPPAPPIDPGFLTLRDNLQQVINEAWFDVAVSITDFQTAQTIDVKGNDPRLPGCTINFFVLLSVVLDLQNGVYPESNVGQIISDTIWGSNAVTARNLLIKTGGGDLYQGIDKINKLLESLGLHSAIFDHPPAFPSESRFGLAGNILTTNQANHALAQLWGNFLAPQWRDYFLEKLTGVKPGLQYLITAGVGGSARVSHKNGFFPYSGGWVDNDIGIVYFERNGRQYAYAISLFMEGIPSKYADIPTGQKISRLVWEYFDNKYQ